MGGVGGPSKERNEKSSGNEKCCSGDEFQVGLQKGEIEKGNQGEQKIHLGPWGTKLTFGCRRTKSGGIQGYSGVVCVFGCVVGGGGGGGCLGGGVWVLGGGGVGCG